MRPTRWPTKRARLARWHGDAGASAVEYAIMASLIAAVVVLSVAYLGRSTNDSFVSTCEAVTAVDGESGDC